MNRFKRHGLQAAMILAGATLTGTALSHNPLDNPDWCQGSGSTTVIAREFTWSGQAIIQSDEEAVCSTRGEGPPADGNCDIIPPTHGQFDDDWHRVQTKIDLFCQQFEIRYPGSANSDHGTVVGIVTGPRSFVDEEGHHQIYSRDLGVEGACVRCQPVALPAPPIRR